MRRQYRNYANYISGYALLTLPKEKTARDTRDKFYIALIDLTSFLRYFSSPGDLYTHLHRKCQEVCGSWRSQNGTKESLGRRRPTNYTEEIARYTWLDKQGREQTSIYYIDLNTFKFTKAANLEPKPKIRIADVKVSH
jgi:hypothetical protein